MSTEGFELGKKLKYCAQIIKTSIKALQVWVTGEPEQQVQPQHLPEPISAAHSAQSEQLLKFLDLWVGKGGSRMAAQTPIPHLFVTDQQSAPAFLVLPNE